MILGRRQFLKFLASAAAGVHTSAVSDTYSSPAHYVDKKLGFGFKIPLNWHLEAFRTDFMDLLSGQKLAEPYDDDRDIMDDLTQGLMATLSKYPITDDTLRRFSPSITFFKGSDDCLAEFNDLLDFTSASISGFSNLLTRYECHEHPKHIDRRDCSMVRSKSKFLYEHKKIDPVMIDDETFVIHYRGTIYTIHLYDSPYTGDTSQDEFRLFRTSLHIA